VEANETAVREGPRVRVPVSQKILLAFLLLTVIFTAVSGYSLLRHHRTASDLRLLRHGYLNIALAIVGMHTDTRTQIKRLEQLSTEKDRAVFAEGLSGVRRVRSIVLASLGKDLDTLLGMTHDEEELAFLRAAKEAIGALTELYAQVEQDYQDLAAADAAPGAPAAAASLASLLERERRIASRLRHLHTGSVQRITNIAWRSEQAETRMVWLLGALILLTVSIGLLAAVVIHRLLLPLGELQRGVEIIGRGDLGHRVPVRRPDEIGLLARRLNEMAGALSERDRRLILAERLAAIGKMASHMAHEVKNPLTSIALNAELVADEAQEVGPDAKKREILGLLGSISREIDRLTSLINHYLLLGKPPTPRLAPADVTALSREVLEFMAPELQARGVAGRAELPDAPVTAAVDRDQLRQALVNLLKNAAEACEESPRKEVAVRVAAAGGAVRIEVRDTGRGMDPAERERVFEPFFSKKKGGSGLGLAITRQIVLDHRGAVECSSRAGEGTAFVVTLPLGAPGAPGEN